MNVYITEISAFLPGDPVSNEDLDKYLGEVRNVSAKTRRIILANNGIKTRYYALDPNTAKITYTNAQLAAEAVRRLPVGAEHPGAPIELLCCGTSTPDQILPGHGSMVHGELACGPCEVMSTAGVCLTGITALKYGAMHVALGLSANAVAAGSELASTFLRNDFFRAVTKQTDREDTAEKHPAFSFEADFLRWMLSDGAGAVLLESQPKAGGISLRVDWIEVISHAGRRESCMYAGAVKNADGTLTGWRECIAAGTFAKEGIMTIKQDARLLNREIIRASVGDSLPSVLAKHAIKAQDFDWFLPHYSSEFFRKPLMDGLCEAAFPIEEERWFTNLTTKGNTGSASFYIMLEELFTSGRLSKGDRILGMVPESGRFSVGWIGLTVV